MVRGPSSEMMRGTVRPIVAAVRICGRVALRSSVTQKMTSAMIAVPGQLGGKGARGRRDGARLRGQRFPAGIWKKSAKTIAVASLPGAPRTMPCAVS